MKQSVPTATRKWQEADGNFSDDREVDESVGECGGGGRGEPQGPIDEEIKRWLQILVFQSEQYAVHLPMDRRYASASLSCFKRDNVDSRCLG